MAKSVGKARLCAGVAAAAVLIFSGSKALAGPITNLGDFTVYSSASAGSIQPGPFALYVVPVDSLRPTQLGAGLAEVGKKAAGFDLENAAQLKADLLTDIEPVVIGPGGALYLTDGHHTFTALEDSVVGATNPNVYVNVIANYSNLSLSQFLALMQSDNLLLPLAQGVVQPVNLQTGAPFPTMLTGLTSDPYRGLEYSILKNKSSKLFPTAGYSTLFTTPGSSIPGLDKMTGYYSDFFEADAYRNANGGLGLPYLSPGDIAIATQWNLTPTSATTLPNVPGTVTAAQLPGFILPNSIALSGVISNATLAGGALDGNGTFTGLTTINAGTPGEPVMLNVPNVGFILQLGADKGATVTLSGANTYTGGTSILAGSLIVANDAALGAAAPASYTIDPNNVKTSVQAANGLLFNSLDEGAGTLTIGTTAGAGTATFTTNRPIAVGGETATLNLNGYVVTLTGQLVSLGSGGGLGNASGESDLTIDDNSSNKGLLILNGNNPNFYGNIIIGGTNSPTVRVFSDAALGNTTGPAVSIGQVVLNGGTFQAGASFSSVRGVSVQSKSTFDEFGFATTFAGALSDIQRNLTITNTAAGTAGAVTFGSLQFGSALELTLKDSGTSNTVTFTNGIQQASASDQLLIAGLSGSAKVLTGSAGAPVLTNGIAAPWLVIDTGASNNPYQFAAYNTNGYTAFTGYATNLLTAGPTSVVQVGASVSMTGSEQVYALNLQKGFNVTIGSGATLTLGDGTNAGLILNGGSGSGLTGGTLNFGAANAYVTIDGSSTISSAIAGTGGLNMAGTGTLTIGAASSEKGLITLNSGSLTLSVANVFSQSTQGLLLQDTKNLANAILTLTASNKFAALNSAGTNSTVAISGAATVLTIGDGANLSSTLSSTITNTAATAGGSIVKAGSGLLDLSNATVNLVAGSSIAATGGALRVATGALKNTAVAASAPNFILSNNADLQFAQSGGGQYAGAISGAGTLHLIGGTLQLTGTSNTYTGGTIVEQGSTLDITTANLPTINSNITNAGGLVVFDQAANGTYAGVISDGAQMGVGAVLSGSLDKDDSTGTNGGDLTLTQAQTYTGATYVEAGTLTLGAVDTIATSNGVTLGRVGGGSAATLALAANNTVQGLYSNTGDTTSVTLGSNTLTLNTPAAVAANFAGAISGSGSLIKTGAGVQTLSGANTYTGDTTVQNGTLALTGSLTSAGRAIVTGGTMTVSGTANLSGATAVSGGLLQIASGGALTTNSVSLTGGELSVAGTLNALNGVSVNGGVLQLGAGASLSSAAIANNGTLDLRGASPGTVTNIGAYTGSPGSQIKLSINFNAGLADRLVVNSVTGSSQIALTDAAPNTPAAYNPRGIPLVVSSSPMNPNAFTLAGGPVAKGLFQYDIAYDPDPQFVLVSVPTADVYRLATVPTAVETLWQDTTVAQTDRQEETRDWVQRGETGAKNAGAATDKDAYSGEWARAFGEWANRDQTRTYALDNKSYSYQTGYSQDTSGLFVGFDGGKRGLASSSDALLLGVSGGYVYSTQSFKSASTTAQYRGASLAATGTYLNGDFFVDGVVKADFLRMDYSASALSGFGASSQTVGVTSVGAQFDAGYRFRFKGSSFIEPELLVERSSSRIGDLGLAGSQIDFGGGEALRAGAGVRWEAPVYETREYRFEGSASVRYWNRLDSGASATILSGQGAPPLSISDTLARSFGEGGLGLSAYSKTNGLSAFLRLDYHAGSQFQAAMVDGGFRFAF